MGNYDSVNYNNTAIDTFKNKMHEARKLRLAMYAEVEKYNRLKDLAFDDEVRTLRAMPPMPQYTCYLDNAMGYLCKENKNAGAFKSLTQSIQENITGGKEIKIINITINGYEKYGWTIEFECDNIKYYLNIPNNSRINKENYFYANMGEIYLGYYPAEGVVKLIATSYDELDISKAFADFQLTKNANVKVVPL